MLPRFEIQTETSSYVGWVLPFAPRGYFRFSKRIFLNSNSIQNSRWKPLCKCMFIFDTAFRKKQLFSPHFFLFWPSFCSLIRKPFLFSTVANYDGKIMILSQNKALKLIFYSSLPFPLQAMTSSLRLTSSFMNEQNFILQYLVFLCKCWFCVPSYFVAYSVISKLFFQLYLHSAFW